MPRNPLKDWISSDREFTYEEWTSVQERYISDRYEDDDKLLQLYKPKHPAFEVNHSLNYDSNWMHLLPEDASNRLCENNDLYSSLCSIVNEVYELLESDVDGPLKCLKDLQAEQSDTSPPTEAEREAGIKTWLCAKIVAQLRGDVDLGAVEAGTIKPPAEEPLNDDFESTIMVHSINERFLEDIAVYTVEKGFFNDRYGDSALMLEKLLISDREPNCLINDVGFYYEGNPWVESSPPKNPITAASIDVKSRGSWLLIESPSDRYENVWGDPDEMGRIDSELDDEVVFSGRVDWRIVIGLRCH